MNYKIELSRNEVKLIAECLEICGYKWVDVKTKSIKEKGHFALVIANFFRMISRKRKRNEF